MGEEIIRWISLKEEFVTSLSSFITQTSAVENIQAIKPAKILFASRESWVKLYQKEKFVQDLWLKAIEENYIG